MKQIFFCTEKVRAILDGRKTVDRQVVKPQPREVYHGGTLFEDDDGLIALVEAQNGGLEQTVSPYRPGDILYVRETWAKIDGDYVFKTDDEMPEGWHLTAWHPSIHMPREAARIFLRVTDVRVERLQDVTEDDVVAEGAEELISCLHEHGVINPDGTLGDMCWNAGCCGGNCEYVNKSYGELFGEIVWNSTLKPKDRALYGWEANPWVWVIEFERISKEEAEHETH